MYVWITHKEYVVVLFVCKILLESMQLFLQ